jgi:hypothetical protein
MPYPQILEDKRIILQSFELEVGFNFVFFQYRFEFVELIIIEKIDHDRRPNIDASLL